MGHCYVHFAFLFTLTVAQLPVSRVAPSLVTTSDDPNRRLPLSSMFYILRITRAAYAHVSLGLMNQI